MRIKNARVFINGSFENCEIEFNEKITDVGKNLGGNGNFFDAKGCFLIPGLVDIHSHGAMGEDVSDGREGSMERLGRFYANSGVTSWCPTTMTLGEDALTKAVKNIIAYKRPLDCARTMGINLEGPFLSAEKSGAQNKNNLHKPDFEMFKRLYDAAEGNIALVSVAPEEEGAMDFISKASKLSAVSLAHTTADYDTAMGAFDAGASHITHMFNAMPSLHHRMPGVIGAAFDRGVSAELITDGFHIHPSVIRLSFKLFEERLCLISDSLRCAGLGDGDYDLGGLEVSMKGGKACLKGTDTLAGSSISLMDGLRRAVNFGIPLEKAVQAATYAPAKAIGREKELGSVAKGAYADFVLLDDKLNIQAVFISGVNIDQKVN